MPIKHGLRACFSTHSQLCERACMCLCLCVLVFFSLSVPPHCRVRTVGVEKYYK